MVSYTGRSGEELWFSTKERGSDQKSVAVLLTMGKSLFLVGWVSESLSEKFGH